jgi:hypothetical protein
MLKLKDVIKAKTRKKLWDTLGFTYKGTGKSLSKNGSLNCGCIICKLNTYNRRVETKKKRLQSKIALKHSINQLSN